MKFILQTATLFMWTLGAGIEFGLRFWGLAITMLLLALASAVLLIHSIYVATRGERSEGR